MRTRALAAAALLAAAAQLAPAQTPPGNLPTTLPVQTPPPAAPPEGGKTPPATPPAPATQPAPAAPVQQLPPVAAAEPAGDCAPCAGPADRGPVRKSIVGTHRGQKEPIWWRVGNTLNYFEPAPLPVPLAVVPGTAGALLGATDIEFGTLNGLTAEGGFWFNDCHTFGGSVGGFLIEQRSKFLTVAGPSLARPFFDVLSGGPNALIVAAPGVATGSVGIGAGTRLSGGEASLWWNIAECDRYSVNFFAGFRYLDLDEYLAIYQTTTPIGPGLTVAGQPVAAGAAVSLIDRFRTRNQFYGGQIGSRYELRRGILFTTFTPKLAFGPSHQTVQIDGQTTAAGQPPVAGGLLALGSPGATANNGRDFTNRFTLLTEFGTQMGVQVTGAMRLAVGYNYLYVNNVARPGSQIDPAVNPRLVPASAAFGAVSGPQAPRLTLDREDFHVHGASFTVEFIY